MLRARKIDRLYSHQALAVNHVLDGKDIVVVTPTASGKTLCYQLPVLNRLLQDETSRALYLFPTKALAHDQLHGMEQDLVALGTDLAASAYDGDTGQSRRRAARDNARVLISNPDMLHVGILPHHVAWREMLANLAFVVIDEMHTYRGVFGSHVAHVLRRLQRLCRFYGGNPQFILASATVANPGELAETLIGRPVQCITESGAPEAERHVVLYNPPIIEKRLGIRRSALDDAQKLALTTLAARRQTVCFTRSRLAVEQMVISLRQQVEALGLSGDIVRGYRAGYMGKERRAIEGGLRSGEVRCVIATSALELGIDIGGLAACILVGYPGSISSTWQRIGRVGRGDAPGLAVLVASGSPLDQYLMTHPEHLFEGAPEAARINPQNLHVRLGQLRSTLYELPISEQETAGDREESAILESLATMGEARATGGRWYWSAESFPASELSLRSADARRVMIVSHEGERPTVIGQVEHNSAPRWLHDEAIYLHEGRQYQVENLDLEGGTAEVRPVAVDFLTVASERTEVQIERTDHATETRRMTTADGEIRLTSQVRSFRRERLDTHEILSWGSVDLPEHVMFTSAFWLGIQPEMVDALERQGLWAAGGDGDRGPNWFAQKARARERDGFCCRQCGAPERPGRAHDVHHIIPFREFGWVADENDTYRQANRVDNLVTLCPRCHRLAERQVAVRSTLADLGHLLRYLVPLWLLCDPGDIGIHTDSSGRRTERPTLFIYDRLPGGAGLATELPRLIMPLLQSAHSLLARCSCEAGCPSCIGPAISPRAERKTSVLGMLAALTAHGQRCQADP